MSTPESNLWRSVIEQAVRDAVSHGKEVKQVIAQRQARAWFQAKTADFAEVCALAGLEPDAVRAHALEIIAEQDEHHAAGDRIKRRRNPAPRRPKDDKSYQSEAHA